MKTFLLIILIVTGSYCFGQDPLIVYGAKGKVSAVYKNVESGVKIGKLLLPGTLVKLEKGASITLLCKKGKQFIVSTEGSYPISKWKDSCRSDDHSVTSNYLAYIWGQFYAYSPEHKSEQKESLLAVSRGDGGDGKRNASSKRTIQFSKGMDEVNYGKKDFNLSWTCFEYDGYFIFRLYDERGTKEIYRDTLEDNFIPLSKMKEVLEVGRKYRWNVSAPGLLPASKRKLNVIAQENIDALALSYLQNNLPSEDTAAMYFRTGYILENKHYLADALEYYKKANKADPTIHSFRDHLIRFRNEFWVQD